MRFLFSDILIFCFFLGYFEAFGALSGYFGGLSGAREVFWGLLIKTDNFYFVRFFVFRLLYLCFSEVILSLFGPIGIFLGLGGV